MVISSALGYLAKQDSITSSIKRGDVTRASIGKVSSSWCLTQFVLIRIRRKSPSGRLSRQKRAGFPLWNCPRKTRTIWCSLFIVGKELLSTLANTHSCSSQGMKFRSHGGCQEDSFSQVT